VSLALPSLIVVRSLGGRLFLLCRRCVLEDEEGLFLLLPLKLDRLLLLGGLLRGLLRSFLGGLLLGRHGQTPFKSEKTTHTTNTRSFWTGDSLAGTMPVD
jgi:hypothetical protein